MDINGQQNILKGKVAVVTGASCGIGASVCKALVSSGVKTIGVARNIQSIEIMKNDLSTEPGELFPYCCDITIDEDVQKLFKTIKERYGGVDICINNAGMSFSSSLLDGTPDEWRTIMNVNVVALCLCSKLSVASMLERGVDDGHIVNVSSVAAHILNTSAPLHIYTASKHAVKAVTEGLRQELRELKSHIRVSSISPGVVETEFLARMFNSEEKGNEVLSNQTNLTADDVTKEIMHILLSHPHVEINDIIMRPVDQAI